MLPNEHNEQNRSVIVIFINVDSPIIIRCKQFIVSIVKYAKVTTRHVSTTTRTQPALN